MSTIDHIFDEIIGHESLKNNIAKSIEMGMFSHAHLIVGEEGIGKSILAKKIGIRILEKEIDRQYADIIEYRVAKNKQSIGVREVTENIIEEIKTKPYESDKKIIIIYQADKMTTEAQNAFLKTVEEPPKGVFIILLCENLEGVLDTIKSRCQIHKLQRLTNEEIKLYLNKKYGNLNDEEIKVIASFSDGIPGRADKFIEDESFKEIRNITIDILMEIKDGALDTNKYEGFFSKYKTQWDEILTWLISYIRDTIVCKETGNMELIINKDKINIIKELSMMFSFHKLNAIIDIVNDTRIRLESNVNAALVFDMLLLKMSDA